MKKVLCLLSLLFLLCGCQSHTDTIKTKYFQVDIPQSWEDMYMYEIYEVDDQLYSLIFYDKASHLTNYGGHIFSISVYYEHDEYDYLPSYEYMNKITDGKDTYIIITEYPTDVQFDVSTQDSYTKLVNSYESIIDSVKYINGFSISNE